MPTAKAIGPTAKTTPFSLSALLNALDRLMEPAKLENVMKAYLGR